MRARTGLLDVTYRVDDPDDASVNVRALAFIDGIRSFANVIRPETFVEGTDASIGDGVSPGVDHILTWNVRADWDVDLEEAHVEILCKDSRELLSFEWIGIPAAGEYPEITISRGAPLDAEVLDALYWLYADANPGLELSNGILRGSPASGVFSGVVLATGPDAMDDAVPFVIKHMGLQPADYYETESIIRIARPGLRDINRWHVLDEAFSSVVLGDLCGWGDDTLAGYTQFQVTPPPGLTNVIAITAGANHSLAVLDDGTVVGWGANNEGQSSPPNGLSNVVSVAVGWERSLALLADGRVVGWGRASAPSWLNDAVMISAGSSHYLALRSNGTVVAWGDNGSGQATPPGDLAGVVAVAAGGQHSLALRSDGTVVAWGRNDFGEGDVPTSLTDAVAIAAGNRSSIALRSNGRITGWGWNNYNQSSPPVSITNATAISMKYQHGLALLGDGTVAGWGQNDSGEASPYAWLTNVTAIAAGHHYSLVLTNHQP